LQDEKHEIFCIDGMLGMGFILIFLRFYSDRARESTKLKRAFWLLNIGLVVKKIKMVAYDRRYYIFGGDILFLLVYHK